MKAHRSEEVDPRNFLLLEELDLSGESYSSVSKKRDSEKLFRRLALSSLSSSSFIFRTGFRTGMS